jgi:hypothetical protein
VIDIPEECTLKEITYILMNDLPMVLLELEEQSEDSLHPPPFRVCRLGRKPAAGNGFSLCVCGD